MPLVHDPEEPTGGPGSAFLSTALSSKVRRRRKKKAPPQQQQESLIGQDMFDFQDESVKSPTPIKPVLKKKKRAPAAKNNATNADEPKPKRRKRESSTSTNTTKQQEKTQTNSMKQNVPPVTPMPLVTTRMTPRQAAPRVRHALAVDTRALDTQEGMTIFQSRIRQEALEFLRILAKRGAAPCILACSTQKATAKSGNKKSPRGGGNNNAIQATAMQTDSNLLYALLMEQQQDDSETSLLQPVPIRPPVNGKNVQNRKAVLVPKRMLAHDSWKLFGDLVEAVVKEDEQVMDEESSIIIPPLDVRILTNDVSFLCDTKKDSHKRGLNRFWERTRPFFVNNAIRSIEIVVAESGVVVLSNANADKGNKGKKKDDATKENKADENAANVDNETLSMVDENAAEQNSKKDDHVEDSEMKQDEAKANEKPVPPETSQEDSHSNHQAASSACIESIKAGLSTRAEVDYKKTRSMEDPPPSVVVNLSKVSSDRLGYHSLVQNCLNNLLSLSRNKGTVSFELPENLDGMQCALSFEATYKVFPFRANSLQASLSMADLRLLSQSKFEVVRLIPLSCVDGSLLFGTPMEVEAKLENDLAQYTEMKALVGFILRFLSEKDVGLLLRATDTEPTARMEEGLFHQDGQTFLLMAKDLPCLLEPSQSQPKAGGDLPSSGVLQRFAIAGQLLDSTSSKPSALEGYELMNELCDLVVSSMESVETSSSNPLVDYALREQKDESPSSAAATTNTTQARNPSVASQESDASVAEEDAWNDAEGVGARMAEANKADSPASPVFSDSDKSLLDLYNAFAYSDEDD